MSTLNKKIIVFSRKYKDALGMLKRSRTNMESMSAAVLFIPDQSEITHLETADYRGSILTLIYFLEYYIQRSINSYQMLVALLGLFSA